MRDLLDDFLEELRRREAIARGEDPDADAPRRVKPVGPDPDGEGPPPARRTTRARRRARRSRSRWAIGLVVLALILVIVFGLDLWTEALWFQSVSFDSVFWTRFTAQLGLFLVATLGAAVITAWRAARGSVSETLRPGTRVSDGASRQRGRAVLATAQIALTLALLATAGRMLSALYRATDGPIGFDATSVLTGDSWAGRECVKLRMLSTRNDRRRASWSMMRIERSFRSSVGTFPRRRSSARSRICARGVRSS